MRTSEAPPETPLHDVAEALRPWLERFELDFPEGPGDASAAVNSLYSLVARTGAEGFLLDPRPRCLELWLRQEGVAQLVGQLSKRHQAALTAALKAPACLDEVERRLPQDGRVRLRLHGVHHDVHVSTLPAIWGERVSCRFADLSGPPSLEALGLDQGALRRLEACLGQPRGVLVVAGPRVEDRQLAGLAALRVATRQGRPGVIVSAKPPAEGREWASAVRLAPHLGLDRAQALMAAHRGGAAVVLVDEPRGPEELRALAGVVRDGVLAIMASAEADLDGALGAFERSCEGVPEIRRELLGLLVLASAPQPCPACAAAPADPEGCRECFGAGLRGRSLSARTRFFPG